MSGLLNQATQAANNLATQATNLVNQAANSDTTANVTSQAKTLGSQAVGAAGTLAGQAHAQAHALAPGIVPAPAEGVDLSHGLKPDSEADKEKLAKALEKKADASELKDKGILKGMVVSNLLYHMLISFRQPRRLFGRQERRAPKSYAKGRLIDLTRYTRLTLGRTFSTTRSLKDLTPRSLCRRVSFLVSGYIMLQWYLTSKM
ncbi:hypothetical protein, variant [Cryptococcus amylolentus CBS 6039]|uniref:Uncharacterized protein n=1 Tax=Cryptococcus amylolentus CBS 6039 TaxID=1295533 RepID=A0A1E3I3J1_9TREE|nr:hypothetical protein, variant [Cryptococcus amylolentus CBS 6039]ODN83230.1 hypothetical protein, variant [Cryptococcus amylolentus CBS 6039]